MTIRHNTIIGPSGDLSGSGSNTAAAIILPIDNPPSGPILDHRQLPRRRRIHPVLRLDVEPVDPQQHVRRLVRPARSRVRLRQQLPTGRPVLRQRHRHRPASRAPRDRSLDDRSRRRRRRRSRRRRRRSRRRRRPSRRRRRRSHRRRRPTTTTTVPPTTIPPTRPTTIPPPSGGLPDASNTGVPAGVTLTPYSGPSTLAAGTVIDSKLITQCLKITQPNVIIRSSRIQTGCFYGIDVEVSSGPALIEDSEVICSGGGNGIGEWGFVVRRVEIRDCENGSTATPTSSSRTPTSTRSSAGAAMASSRAVRPM